MFRRSEPRPRIEDRHTNGFRADFIRQAIQRGSFASVKELIGKIDAFVAAYNRPSKPFAWTATAEPIFLKLKRLLSRISGTRH